MRDLGAYARRQRTSATRAAICALLMLLAACAIADSAYAEAHAARALNITDTAHLHHGKESGAMLVDEGTATGQLPGRVRVEFNVGATVRANFTIYTSRGALMGHGSGTLHESRNSGHSTVWVSFAGTMTVSHGTGIYTHAHGHGGFYGVFDRHNYEATIETTGTLDD